MLAVFDFLRPKKLLRSLRPVRLSCLLRFLRPLMFSEPLRRLNLINQWLLSPHYDVFEKNIFKKNDVISSEIPPFLRIEAVEDRVATFDQIQGS